MDNTSLRNFTTNSLVALPIFFTITLAQPDYKEVLVDKKYNAQTDVKDIFQQLPSQNNIIEPNQMDVLVSFVSKLVNDSKDLDGEIVDMVNRKFKQLLLKI